MSAPWVQAFGDEVYRQAGVKAGMVKEELTNVYQQELRTQEAIPSATRGSIMTAGVNRSQFLSDMSRPNLQYLQGQEDFGYLAGNTFMDAVATPAARLGATA
ncbi:hypothetical protein OG474_20395 [Kribbella sp. NBC_01505]|uniref:hypothetical protein n=1 Tax=Kribbella sp. NBC_01505 TaxID=2903580 RepID=UPI00386E63A4